MEMNRLRLRSFVCVCVSVASICAMCGDIVGWGMNCGMLTMTGSLSFSVTIV